MESVRQQSHFSIPTDSVRDGLVILDEERILSANTAFLNFFHMSCTDLKGTEICQWLPEDCHNVITDRDFFLEKQSFRTVLTQMDGNRLNLELRGDYCQLEDRRRAMLILRDISDFVETEETLFQQNQLFELIIRTISDPILIVGLKYRVLYCNEAFCKLFEYPPDTLLGKRVSQIYADKAAYRQACWHWAELAETVEKEPQLLELRTRFDTMIRVEARSGLIHSPAGEIQAYVSIFHKTRNQSTLPPKSGVPAGEDVKTSTELEYGVGDEPRLVAEGLQQEPATSPSREVKECVDLNDLLQDFQSSLSAFLQKQARLVLQPGKDLPRVPGQRARLANVVMALCLTIRDEMLQEGVICIRTHNQIDPDEEGLQNVLLVIEDATPGRHPPLTKGPHKLKLNLEQTFEILTESGATVGAFFREDRLSAYHISFPSVS